MDRFRALLGKKKNKEADARRRASHAGFEAPKFEDLRKRRQSLPANLRKKDEDEARKLHNSAACVNIIEEMKAVKLIPKTQRHKVGAPMPMRHALDPFLQKQLRARRNSGAVPAIAKSIEHVPNEPVVKRANSMEGLNKKLDRDMMAIARSSSESLLTGIDVQDPEEAELSDDESQPVAASA